MKKLLTKFRLSNALDTKAGECRCDDPELRDFAQQVAALDRAMRNPPAVPPGGAALHLSIMRAVRVASAEASPKTAPNRIWLATASAALAGICIWFVVRPAPVSLPQSTSTGAQTLAAAQTVLDMGREVSRSIPAALVGPLSNELACVDHDIRDTTQFILGTLP